MIGMSIFDMFSSTAYMLVGVMAPYDAGFYLSRGNITTCKIQGCMIQLGQTGSMLYNLFLSLFFFFVIVFGWREQRFKKMIVWVHMVVVLTSVALAAAVIPFVQAQFGVCGILPPLTSSQWQISLFYTGPVVAVLLVLDTTTATICRRTYLQQQRARKWQLGNSNMMIVREVFWQSFWYVSAFHLTLPWMLVSFYAPFRYPRGFWIFIVTAILAPLQGLMNAIVYFKRPRSKNQVGSCSKVFGFICTSVLVRWIGKRGSTASASMGVAVVGDKAEEFKEEDVVENQDQRMPEVGDWPQTGMASSSSMPAPAEVVGRQSEAKDNDMASGEIALQSAAMSASYRNFLELDEGILEFWRLHEPSRIFEAGPSNTRRRQSWGDVGESTLNLQGPSRMPRRRSSVGI